MRYLRAVSILVIAIVAGAVTATAQRTYDPNFALGVKGGATFGLMSFSPSPKQTFLPGITFGVTARYMEENHFGLIAEVNLTQRGWRENFEGAPFSYSRSLTYIQIPLLTHIYFGSRHVKGFFNLGPEVGYMIGSKINADFDYNSISTIPGFPSANRVTEQMAMKVANHFDYGIAAGVGIELVAGSRNSFYLEGRYYYGLGNIFPAAKKDYFSASRAMAIEATIGYSFRLR
ncbi:MAG: PorT family protein [Muribaculaceae bacterium]|nr:PorT family protein [Muribaculaceae bacterium]